jgi:tetratricopeptide (TPR) repeat protein
VHDVFVSYSSKDKPTADAICAKLESVGIRCWVAPRDMVPGQEWGAAIIEAIKGARVMVLVFSAHANGSPQINREVERAVNRGLPVIPFRIENVAPVASLEYFISTPHWLDAFAPPLEKHLQHLAQVIRQLLGTPLVPAQAAPTTIHQPFKSKGLKIALLFAGLLVALAAWWLGVEKPQRNAANEKIIHDQQARLATEHAQQQQLAEAKAKADEAERQRQAAEENARQESAARLALEQQQKLAEARARADAAERQQKAAEEKTRQAEAARLALENQRQEAEQQRQSKIADGIKSAQAALQLGQFADARQQFQSVLALDEGNAQAKTGLAEVDKAERPAARTAAAMATNIVSAKKFTGIWKGTVDYPNVLVGGIQDCTVVIDDAEEYASTSLQKTVGQAKKRKTIVSGNVISWKVGWFASEPFTMTVAADGQSASVSVNTATGTGFGTLKKQ